jgi:nicotinate-nucleotide pyrophosphorylase (carboxylating)
LLTAELQTITILPVEITSEYLLDLADRALVEDIGAGDVTTDATVSSEVQGHGVIVAKKPGIISGLDIAGTVFLRLDQDTRFDSDLVEGSPVEPGTVVATVQGYLGTLLSAERVALNFLMHLSGIATLTSKFVKEVEGTGCRILDTRKTTPGLRLLEKRAVASGGGQNHRIGLFDMILIKDNHIAAAGSISAAIEAALSAIAATERQDLLIEVETQSVADIEEALKFPIQRVMIDNMDVAAAASAVKLIRKIKPDVEIEASGNMALSRVRTYAETGIDFISVGALTHSAECLDLSMRLQMQSD